jgi:hypothetical protein
VSNSLSSRLFPALSLLLVSRRLGPRPARSKRPQGGSRSIQSIKRLLCHERQAVWGGAHEPTDDQRHSGLSNTT